MRQSVRLEYWLDGGWYVGRLVEVPGVFSQGQTLAELEENIQDAYDMLKADGAVDWLPSPPQSKPIEVEV